MVMDSRWSGGRRRTCPALAFDPRSLVVSLLTVDLLLIMQVQALTRTLVTLELVSR
jgi:hypothetical protein